MNGENKLLILVSNVSPRVEYIFDFIFKTQMGLAWDVTTSASDFENYNGPKINYTSNRIGEHLFIKEYGLLTETGINSHEINVTENGDTKIFFQQECDTGFDIFSAAFYLLSRYEEYLPYTTDDYGRFKETSSLAYKNNFLRIPIIDTWVKNLKDILKERFPQLNFKTKRFNAIMTYDIDVAYKYKGRGFFRIAGSLVKHGLKDPGSLKDRMATLRGKIKDPWDVYDNLKDLLKKYELPSIFFFLVGNRSKHDHNLFYKNAEMQNLVKKIQSFSEVGIHPSYNTSLNNDLIDSEKNRLEYLTKVSVTKSRQHYLKFSLPNTFSELSHLGIKEDYSMAYAESSGFRAGTSFPYFFYDLNNEKVVSLKMFPSVCMEVTFKDFLNASPEDFLKECKYLADEVNKVNGTFISIWHNNTLGNDNSQSGWLDAHEALMKYLYDIKNTISE